MRCHIPPDTVYQVMTEQPDTCHRCGARLELLEITNMVDERVFVCHCLECHHIIPVVEDDIDDLDNKAEVI